MADPKQLLADLQAEVTEIAGVVDSAVALINGIGARIQAAVDAAIAGGATAEQLAPIQDEINALDAKSKELAAAVQANTPVPTPSPNPEP